MSLGAWMSFFSGVSGRNKPEVKWLQDCATLRCKQQRQPEARDLRRSASSCTLLLCLLLGPEQTRAYFGVFWGGCYAPAISCHGPVRIPHCSAFCGSPVWSRNPALLREMDFGNVPKVRNQRCPLQYSAYLGCESSCRYSVWVLRSPIFATVLCMCWGASRVSASPGRALVCVCVCTSLVHERRGSPPIFLQGDGGGAGELRPTKLSPAPWANVPALPAPGPRRGQLAGHSSSFILHLISYCVIPLCLTWKGAETLPLTDHLISFCMPFLMSGMLGTNPSFQKCLEPTGLVALSLSSPLPTSSSFILCVVTTYP